jgi:hypothetical protein
MLDITLSPLAVESKTFNAGETVRVTVSFSYKVGLDTGLNLLAAPYYTNLFGKHLVGSCAGQSPIMLEASVDPVEKTAAVDMILVPQSLGGIENGTYGLVIWLRPENSSADPWDLPSPLARSEQDSVLIVSGNSSGGTDIFGSMMPVLMIAMMFGMITPMLSEGGE